MELMVFESLTMQEYHNICSFNLSQFRTISISISTSMAAKPGAIISCSSSHPLEDPVGIVYAPNVDTHVYGWRTSEGANRAVMEDSWTQYFILFFQ
jgi:hypothetical protein